MIVQQPICSDDLESTGPVNGDVEASGYIPGDINPKYRY